MASAVLEVQVHIGCRLLIQQLLVLAEVAVVLVTLQLKLQVQVVCMVVALVVMVALQQHLAHKVS
jgi:hypothetical protein